MTTSDPWGDIRIDGPTDSGAARGTVSATLIDTITLTSPVIKVSIDINGFTTQHTEGEADFAFVFRFADPTPDNLEDQGPTPIFGIEAFHRDSDEGIDQGDAIYLLDSETPIETGSSIPGSFDFEIDLSDPAFAALFTSPFPPFPVPFSLDDPNLFEFTLVARANCDDDPCSATSRLDETLYIKLEGNSANGYSYLGATRSTRRPAFRRRRRLRCC